MAEALTHRLVHTCTLPFNLLTKVGGEEKERDAHRNRGGALKFVGQKGGGGGSPLGLLYKNKQTKKPTTRAR